MGAAPQEAFLSGADLREEAVTAWLRKLGALTPEAAIRAAPADPGASAANSESVRMLPTFPAGLTVSREYEPLLHIESAGSWDGK